jgi:hypothetical protein
MTELILLNNNDLFTRQYPIAVLEANIDNLYLVTILQTQVLSAEFCCKYFWAIDDEYAQDEDDREIYLNDILLWQPHLSAAVLEQCFMHINKNNI